MKENKTILLNYKDADKLKPLSELSDEHWEELRESYEEVSSLNADEAVYRMAAITQWLLNLGYNPTTKNYKL